VLVVGLLAVAAVPALKRHAFSSRAAAVSSDLRAFAAAFQAYAREHGDWPAGGTPPGVLPPGMDGYLPPARWARVTPIGGHYQFATQSPQAGARYAAVIIIAPSRGQRASSDYRQLSDIDTRLDDGNLATGNFFLGYRNYPVFVLEH